MPGDFIRHFEGEHGALLALLEDCLSVDEGRVRPAFELFRRRLLQGIAMEERVLLPALVRRLGRVPRWRRVLRQDHVSLVRLCVLAPHREWLEGLVDALVFHHAQKQRFVARCEVVLEPAVLSWALALPPVEVPPLAEAPREVPQRLRWALRAVGLG